jgi:hypothetical protein
MPEVSGGDTAPRVGVYGEDFNPARSIGKTVCVGPLQAGYGQSRMALEAYASNLEAAFVDRSSGQTFLFESWWDSNQWIVHGKPLASTATRSRSAATTRCRLRGSSTSRSTCG